MNDDSNVSLPTAPDSEPRRRPGRPRNPENVGVSLTERKTSIYLKGDTLEEIRSISAKLDRSVSWTLSRAFAIAKSELERMSSDV